MGIRKQKGSEGRGRASKSKTDRSKTSKPVKRSRSDEPKSKPAFGKGKFVVTRSSRPLEPQRKPRKPEDDFIRLNKFISNAGICSRREADVLIATGVIAINGKVVTDLGIKVKPGDQVQYDGETINAEKKQYVLLNKPKNFITSVDDPKKRRTVMHLVDGACKERIYPVGRLDRMTTGLLLFTNDGDMAKKLTHPKHGVRKIYHIELKEKVKPNHLRLIKEGIELEDGPIKADEIEYVGDGTNMHQVGIEIHSGKNRIVRRIFEHLGYTVKKLDRVSFASLTKKEVPRGTWRHLSEKEVNFLRMLG